MMKNPIEWTRVREYTYNTEAYLKDIPVLTLVGEWLPLTKQKNQTYRGWFFDEKGEHEIIVNDKENKIYHNGAVIDPEEFVLLIYDEREVNINDLIKDVTGIDMDDYIATIYYEDGSVEHRMNEENH